MGYDWEPCQARPEGPCLNEVVERHDGVTVEVLRCRRCGRRTIQWMRPEIAALQDAIIEGENTASPIADETPPPKRTKTAAGEPEPREYWEAAEAWLRTLQQYNVNCVAMAALIDDPDVHDVIVTHGTGPFELSAIAGILQMMASHKYGEAVEDIDDEEDDEDGDEDDV